MGRIKVKYPYKTLYVGRGRNKDNPSDRKQGIELEQRLEPNSEGICNTLTSVQKDNLVLEPTVKIKQATKEGYIDCKLGGVADLSYPTSKTRRGRVGKQISQTLLASSQPMVIEQNKINVVGNYSPSGHDASRIVHPEGVAPTVKENHGTVTATISNLRIRKLIPKECWRLMGFDDEDFYKAEQVNSNTQLYRQSGNSIVVDVLEAIFKQML